MSDTCSIRLLLVGEKGVGKTSLINQFIDHSFKPLQRPTAVLDLKKSSIEVDGKKVNLEIWDTAGEKKYHAISSQYYAEADVFMLVFDVRVKEISFALQSWLSRIRKCNDSAIVFLVGNKNEDPSKVVAIHELEDFAQKERLEFICVSSLSGDNVEKAFSTLVRQILIKKGQLVEDVEDDFEFVTPISPIELKRSLVVKRR